MLSIRASRFVYGIFGVATLGLCALGASQPAHADPWLSVESGLHQEEVAEVFGDGFQPNSELLLIVTDPTAGTDIQLVVSDAQGAVSADITLDHAGEYIAEIYDADGGGSEPMAEVIIFAAEAD